MLDEEIPKLVNEGKSTKGLGDMAIGRGSNDNVSVVVAWR